MRSTQTTGAPKNRKRRSVDRIRLFLGPSEADSALSGTRLDGDPHEVGTNEARAIIEECTAIAATDNLANCATTKFSYVAPTGFEPTIATCAQLRDLLSLPTLGSAADCSHRRSEAHSKESQRKAAKLKSAQPPASSIVQRSPPEPVSL